MTEDSKKEKRGTPVSPPLWWWRDMWRVTRAYTDAELTTAINNVAAKERGEPWDRTTVGKFRKAKWPTFEIVVALCRAFSDDGLTVPVFVARSKVEANAMLRVQDEHTLIAAREEEAKRFEAEARGESWETKKMAKLLDRAAPGETELIAEEALTETENRKRLTNRGRRRVRQ